MTAEKWRKAAAQLAVDEDELLGRISDLAELLPDALASAAAEPTVAALGSLLPQRLVDLVAQRCSSLTRVLG